ncbi:DNA cytosine methyltransferase [Nitratireductor aquimarinus]|uniref:DNA cytosine methyltransferase n=1 Tax=Nitratireductor TaxID=245876 RepID=UPI0019D408A6|nr:MULTISPECIES: DNA cytosine methyltransferase [Nitratireductor]MBN7777747.1 DNA cytosine methyltransferase [Nitratireductor pacificus]MBN7781741.1 DNA cytosine methyltransferase [Nitratireductor pacificus]MBN7790547.1 DNA cytosine methyltransferase [Nitratireductor aquimarinus]MBY6099957.1 DNA cytosine methyltransferase [Nitratireductor aquimarinus]MCA1260423.1 DNA cytosine methyltransferase [Nitratireductor aquimarinus]
MRAYYNEIDPAAAHILCALIKEGVIANGDVDTRSIKEVEPHDLEGYTQCHFFAGGGLWSVAARLAGWPDDAPLWTGSCPCQPFSAAGKGLGTDDPRHLWPDFHRLIGACRPAVVMGEQVAGKAGYGWFDGVRVDLAREDFTARAIDFPACSVDAPHQRNRLYWIAMEEPDSWRHAGRGVCGPSKGDSAHEQRPYDQSGGSDCGERRPLDHGIGSRLEGQRGHGDGSGRKEPDRPVAEADGAEPEHMADRAVKSLLSGRPGEARRPQGADAGESRALSGREFAHLDGRSIDRRNGTYWSDAEWIACHDGKARRAQSGIRFLVDGLPGRVDLWRVGGNAIVPEAAAEVIAAFMDVYGVPVSKMKAAA